VRELQRAYGDLRQVNAKLGRELLVLQQAEEGVRQSEQRFRDYAETASDWFWETGPDHVFTYISERLDAFGMGSGGTDRQAPLRCGDRPGGRATEMA
jgi:PAS domain-containing protein